MVYKVYTMHTLSISALGTHLLGWGGPGEDDAAVVKTARVLILLREGMGVISETKRLGKVMGKLCIST